MQSRLGLWMDGPIFHVGTTFSRLTAQDTWLRAIAWYLPRSSGVLNAGRSSFSLNNQGDGFRHYFHWFSHEIGAIKLAAPLRKDAQMPWYCTSPQPPTKLSFLAFLNR